MPFCKNSKPWLHETRFPDGIDEWTFVKNLTGLIPVKLKWRRPSINKLCFLNKDKPRKRREAAIFRLFFNSFIAFRYSEPVPSALKLSKIFAANCFSFQVLEIQAFLMCKSSSRPLIKWQNFLMQPVKTTRIHYEK